MLQLNKTYKNYFNEDVKIISTDEYDKNVFLDSLGRSYFSNGKYFYNNPKYDLSLIDQTFQKINEILSEQIDIKPCPICGSEIDLNIHDSGYEDFVEFDCSNRDCGFSYHPENNYLIRKDRIQNQKIINDCIKQVNKRA